MSEIACTCGDCKLEVINTCRCEFAAKMRGELLAQLDVLDLTTEAARRSAADGVRASFVARYGGKALDRTDRLDPNGHGAALVIAMIALSLVVRQLARRASRRRARQNGQGA